jgi:2-polyprenyl-3-methyl-5-hydroxy-6-metoxy-1,4-benzoquinol methylase
MFTKSYLKSCPVCASKEIQFNHRRSDDRYGYLGWHAVYRCAVCTAYFLQDPVAESAMGELYERYYPSLHAPKPSLLHTLTHRIPFFLRLFRKLVGTVPLIERIPKGAKVLDVGCGFYPELASEVRAQQLDWTGLEINEKIVAKIKEAGLACYAGIPESCVIQEKFDYILLSQVIEHQSKVVANIRALARLLNPQGRIIILTPSTDSMYLKRYGKKWLHWHTPYHTVIFNKKSIRMLANQAALVVESYTTYTPTYWYVLQKNFRLVFGKENHSVKGTLSILPLVFHSLHLRLRDMLAADTNDCMYCVLRKSK